MPTPRFAGWAPLHEDSKVKHSFCVQVECGTGQTTFQLGRLQTPQMSVGDARVAEIRQHKAVLKRDYDSEEMKGKSRPSDLPH